MLKLSTICSIMNLHACYLIVNKLITIQHIMQSVPGKTLAWVFSLFKREQDNAAGRNPLRVRLKPVKGVSP